MTLCSAIVLLASLVSFKGLTPADSREGLAFNVDFWHFYSVAELPGTSSAAAQKWDAVNLGKPGWRGRYSADAAGATAYLDDILRGKVTRFMMNVNAQRSGFKSDVLETYGEAKVADNDTEANLVRVVRALREQKVDLYALWIGRCRERRVSPWLSVRMNDMHRFDLKDCPSISDFWRQHPELRRFKGETPKDCNGWAAQTFDFGQAVVRERMLNYIRECLAKYDVDGIELDWLRFPWLFARGEEAKNAPLLTEMVREIRRAADEAAKRRGHPVRISIRATARPETEIAMGRAVDVWAREGLVDEVMAANHYKTVDFEIPVARWKQLLGPKVRFVGYADNGICDGPNGARRPMVLEEYYGWADQMHARGCRDFALYNLFGHDPRSTEWNGVLSGGLSPEAVVRAARRYPLSFRDSRFTWSSIGTDHEYPQRLPSKLDKPFACGLDVGTVPAGSACDLWLGFDKAEGELPKAAVNGVEVADAVPVGKSVSLVRYALPPGAVIAGRNSVTVQPALGHRLTYVALRVVPAASSGEAAVAVAGEWGQAPNGEFWKGYAIRFIHAPAFKFTANAAACIASRGRLFPEDFPSLVKGIRDVKNHIFGERYNAEIAAIRAVKVMFAAKCLMTNRDFADVLDPDIAQSQDLSPELRSMKYIRSQDRNAWAMLVTIGQMDA